MVGVQTYTQLDKNPVYRVCIDTARNPGGPPSLSPSILRPLPLFRPLSQPPLSSTLSPCIVPSLNPLLPSPPGFIKVRCVDDPSTFSKSVSPVSRPSSIHEDEEDEVVERLGQQEKQVLQLN